MLKRALISTDDTLTAAEYRLHEWTTERLKNGLEALRIDEGAQGVPDNEKTRRVDIHSVEFADQLGDWRDEIRRKGFSGQVGYGSYKRGIQGSVRFDPPEPGGFGRIGSDRSSVAREFGVKSESLSATECRILGPVNGLRGASPTLLGSAINRNFREDGGTSPIGQKIEAIGDLSRLRQFASDTRFEALQVFCTDQDGQIVGESTYSSRRSNLECCYPLQVPTRLRETMRELDAMGYRTYVDAKEKEQLTTEATPLERAAKSLSVINNETQEIRRNVDLTPAEKRQKLDALTVERNALLKQAVTESKVAQKEKP